jgi:hypothetical protein
MNYVELARVALWDYQLANTTRHGTTETSKTTESLESVLKGHPIELWSDALGERFWLVADEEDAAELREPRGTVYTAAEARRVTRIGDPKIVAEIHHWKQKFDAVISQNGVTETGIKAKRRVGRPRT